MMSELSKSEQKKEVKELFQRGKEIVLPSGESGIYLEKGKGGTTSWLLVGGLSGPKRTETNKALVSANFPDFTI